MIHLQSISNQPAHKRSDVYPFNTPFLHKFRKLTLKKPVTILVGKNGTGKSTLLEGLAANIGSILIGGEQSDRELSQELAQELRLTWRIKTRQDFNRTVYTF